MLSLFRPRLPVDDEELEFLLATFKWLTATFGPAEQAPLVVPTQAFFPSIAKSGRAPACELFDDVRRAADMEDWPCELEGGERDLPTDAGNDHLIRHDASSAPCGTFRIDERDGGSRVAVITYNPDMEQDQAGLVATFAHELAHYLLATEADPGPGGWELHELHTDVAAVYLGFGIFLANSARTFEAFHGSTRSGWSSRLQGYLSESALVTATLVFQRLAGRDPYAASPYLEDHLRTELKRAERALAKRHPDLSAAVEAVDLSEYGCG
jgi:hypothetical protein